MTSDSWNYLTLKTKSFYLRRPQKIPALHKSKTKVFVGRFFTLDLVKKEPLYVGFKSFKTSWERYIFDVSIHCYCFHSFLSLKIVNFYVKWQSVIFNFSCLFLVKLKKLVKQRWVIYLIKNLAIFKQTNNVRPKIYIFAGFCK